MPPPVGVAVCGGGGDAVRRRWCWNRRAVVPVNVFAVAVRRAALCVCVCCAVRRRRQRWTTTPTRARTHASDSVSGGKKVSRAQGRRRRWITRGRHSSRAKSIRASTPPPPSSTPQNTAPAELYHHAQIRHPKQRFPADGRPMRSAPHSDCTKTSRK